MDGNTTPPINELVVLYLFFFNRLVAFLLSYFLRLYIWRKHRAYISIESIQFGILAGRILFKNIHYVGENMSLSILQGHVTFRYWLKAVRGHTATTNMDPPTSQVDEDLPCRIICILEGVEVFIYNNTETYRDAKRQLDPEQEPEERTSERTPTQSSRETELDKIRKYLDSSIFLKLLPIQIDCRVGAIVIGNSRLESLLTIEFSEGGGVYTATRAKSLLDYYQSQLFMKLGRVRVSLREHADYGQIDKTWRNYTNMARQKRGWFQRWCLCNSIEATEEDTSEYEMTPNLKQYPFYAAAYDSLTNKEMQYAAVADVLECSQLDILYYSDVVGTVPPLDQHLSIENDKIGNGDIAPEWGLQLAITNSLIQYGPWADNQRGQLQDFFYPAIYRNQRVTPFLQHNDPRMHTAFNLNIQFMGDTNFRIPTREPSKDWLHVSEPRQSPTHPRGAAAARPYGWLDLQMAPDSSLSVVVPSIVDDIGYTTKVELYMRNVDITTSVDYASLLLASECRFVGYMESPRIWNAKRLWTYSVSVNKPEIFLLRDHITLVVDLINDWTAGPPADMAHFIPMAYEYHISLSDLKLRMCVNEHNVINQTNDFDENAFITLSTPIFALEFKSQFFDYLPQEVSMPFQIKVADAGLSMDLPSLDTNGAFLSEEARHCLSVGILELGGSFEYHPQVDVDHVDCLTLRIKVDDVTGRLFGFIIRYIIILADNYFGEYVDFTTTDDYRNGLNDTTSRRLRVRRRQASKPASNQFEVHVIAVITRGFLFLPETLYSLGERPLLLEFDELQVDNRNVSFYQDLFISSSPIKLSRGSPAMSGRRTQASAARSMWERTECIYLDELSIHGHRLFGPMPNTLTYVCHWEIDLGQLSGRVRPALLEAVVSAVQRLDYQMDDFENALPHQLSPSGYPDVTFLRVGVRQIDLTIWGSQETATQLLISEGIRVEFQDLIGEKYSKKTLVAVPQVILRSLAATKSNANDPAILPAETLIWTEVAYVETSIDFTAYTHTSDWYEKREQQRNFIHDQDRETRRCAFLYSSDTDTIHEALGDELTRPDHQGALYIPPFQPSFADDDSTVLAIHRHSLQSYSTGQYSAGSQSFPVERDISDHEQDISGSDSDSGVEEEEEEGRVDERGEHLNLLTSPSRYSLSNRSKLSRRSSAVESFRTAWESRHSRSTYEGRDVDDNDSDIEDELNDDEALLYSPDEDVLLDAPSKPLSIPYHKYLRRFQIERSWQPGGNGHIYIKPPLTRFNPEMDQEETITDESWRPPFYDMWREFVRDHYDSTTINYFEDGEHRSAFVIDMQRSVDLLVTPVFLRIVGDLLESLDSEDRSPDKLLDSLHIGYMSRFFTAHNPTRVTSTLWAVAVHVALPADLTSYDGYSNHRTLYDLSGTLLCAAEVILDAFTLRLTQQTVEASKDLPQLKLNVSLGSVRSNLRFVSSSDFTGITGIPGVMCSIEPSTTVQQQDSGRNEPVVVSCSADDISIQLSGGGTLEDRLVLDMQSISATCVHQAIEIVAGAAVSWLSFVDQLERILKPFAARWSARDRLLVAALAESSAKEVMPGGDAAFLTRPSIAWRLSPPAFQNDSGWWLLARLRHCAHSLSAIQINRVKQRIRSLDLQDRLRFEELYEATRRHLSTWIHWDNERDSRCYLLDKLFGRPIVTDARTSVSALPAGLRQQGLDLDTLLDRLAREKAGISYRLARIHVCIYEPKSENNIAIGPITANFESRRRDNHGDYSRWTPDAKLSILARFSVSQIDIDISPSMLSLIKHALEVQRSFSAYQPLNHFMYERDSLAQQQQRVNRPYSNDFTSRSSTAPVTTPTNNVTTMKWIEHLRRNITVQCFVSLQLMTITASAHNLLLRSQLSALHLTMLLTPFNTTNSNTPSSSPSTAVNMAVMSTISAMLRRFDVVIQELQIKPHSLRMKHPPTTLLEIELNRQSINGSAVLFDPLKSMTTLPDLLNVMGGLGGISIRIPQSLLKLYHFVEEWKTDNLPTYDFLLHRIRNEWKQTRKPATPVPMQVISTTPTESKDWLQLLASRLRVHLLIDTLTLHADTLPSLSGCYIARQLMLTMQPGQSQVVDIQGQIHDQKVKFSTRSTNTPQLLPSNDTISHGVFPIPAIRFGSRYRFKHNPASTSTSNSNSNNNNNQRDVTSMAKSRHKPIPPPISTTHNTTTTKTYAANTSNVNLLDVVVTVDFVDLVLDADLMDKVITIQGLLGNEVNDALEVFVAAKKRYSTSNTAIISQDTSPESNQGDISDKTTKNSGLGLYYSISVALLSARVTAVSPAAAMILESDVLRGYLTNHIETKPFSIDSEMYWKVVAKGLNLSLCHGSVVMASTWSRDKQWRHKRLAFILLDFKLQNFRERSSMKRSDHLPTDACARRIYICIDRAHAVMQPVALGKLVDFAIFYSRELSRRREAKAGEIQRLTDNTRRMLRSLDVELPKYKETGRSLLEDKSISIQVSRLTVAMPLVRDWEGGTMMSITSTSNSGGDTESSSHSHHDHLHGVPAFLISATAIDLLTRRWEASCGLLNNFYIQFVPRFNQSVEEHFDPAWHPRVNRVLLPALQCEVHAAGTRQMKQVWFDAWADGLEVDIDSQVVHHIGTLSAIWEYSRDRFEFLTIEALDTNTVDTDTATAPIIDTNTNNDAGESILLAIEARLSIDSGTCRFHPHLPRLLRHTPNSETNNNKHSTSSYYPSKRVSARFGGRTAQSSHPPLGASISTSTQQAASQQQQSQQPLAETNLRRNYDNCLVVPGLSLRTSVKLPLGSSHKNLEAAAAQRAHVDVHIHASENVLYPTLVPFIDELLSGLQSSLAQSSPQMTPRPLIIDKGRLLREKEAEAETSAMANTTATAAAISIPNMPISIYLRLSRTQVKLSCEPTAQVSGLLDWADGRLLIALTPGHEDRRQLTFSGRILDLSVRVQHAFSPEHCLSAATGAIVCSASMIVQPSLYEQTIPILVSSPSIKNTGHHDSNDNAVSLILDMPGITSDLNIRHLQDWLTFERCWISRWSTTKMNSDAVKSNEDITSNTSIPASIPLHTPTRSNNAMLKSSSTTNTNTTSDTSTLLGNSTMPWSIFIIFNLRNFSLNADLSQAIGIATAELTNISLSSRTIPGRISASSLRLGAAGLRSDGRIHSDLAVKEININLASLLCTLPTGPGSSYLLALHLDFAGLSAMVDYEYQRILLAELGAIRARAGDRWINFGLDDAQIKLNCNIDLGHVEAIIATKTIPLIMRTADKISGLVQEKQSIVRTLFLDYETSGDNTTTTNRLSIAIPAPIPPTRTRSSTSMSQLVNDAFVTTDLQPKLALNINIGAVKAAVYPYYLSDSDCARAILQTFNLSLIRDVQSASDITKRDLQLKLDMLSLVKTQCRKMDGRDERDLPMSAWVTRVQEGTARNILSLPAATLSTQARRAADGLHTDLTFTTEFIGHVDIALNFGLIKYLQELGALYKRQMDQRDASADYPKKSVPSTPAATTSDESDPMAKAATVSTADTLSTADEAAKTATTATATATATNDNGGGATAKYPLANKMIYTVVEPVRFDPKLRVMGDATPPLEWIGVQRQRLPIILNEELADPLEKGMLQLQEVYSNAIALRKHGM